NVATLTVTLICWQAKAAMLDPNGAPHDPNGAPPHTNAALPVTKLTSPNTTGASVDPIATEARRSTAATDDADITQIPLFAPSGATAPHTRAFETLEGLGKLRWRVEASRSSEQKDQCGVGARSPR